MTTPDSLDQIIAELLVLYKGAEQGVIWEYSSSIQSDLDALDRDIKEYRARYERLTGRTLEETKP